MTSKQTTEVFTALLETYGLKMPANNVIISSFVRVIAALDYHYALDAFLKLPPSENVRTPHDAVRIFKEIYDTVKPLKQPAKSYAYTREPVKKWELSEHSRAYKIFMFALRWDIPLLTRLLGYEPQHSPDGKPVMQDLEKIGKQLRIIVRESDADGYDPIFHPTLFLLRKNMLEDLQESAKLSKQHAWINKRFWNRRSPANARPIKDIWLMRDLESKKVYW